INQLLDRLYQQEIINDQERDDVMEEKTSADKARKLLKEVQKKGPDAVSVLKTALREVNPYLCKTLNLK
uniref:CARD domain-containing protein n=1 Tax=Acanthochromis polyacanthus TaxID=80966 RepID=A0A3Q1G851_9TELE